MDGVKGLLSSKTVWGVVFTLLGALLSRYGYTITAADQVAIVDTVGQVVAAGGSALAIYGRVTATKVIGKPNA